jgi:hypothetical protein
MHVMGIRDVSVGVSQRRMLVQMAMQALGHHRVMVEMMAIIMRVGMLMLQRFMVMFVAV